MLAAFLGEGVAESDFAGSFGYGYDDPARAKYEALLARIFGAPGNGGTARDRRLQNVPLTDPEPLADFAQRVRPVPR